MAFPENSHSVGPAALNSPPTRTSWTDTLSALHFPPSRPAWSTRHVCSEYSSCPVPRHYTLKVQDREKEKGQQKGGGGINKPLRHQSPARLKPPFKKAWQKPAAEEKKLAMNSSPLLPSKRLPLPSSSTGNKWEVGQRWGRGRSNTTATHQEPR